MKHIGNFLVPTLLCAILAVSACSVGVGKPTEYDYFVPNPEDGKTYSIDNRNCTTNEPNTIVERTIDEGVTLKALLREVDGGDPSAGLEFYLGTVHDDSGAKPDRFPIINSDRIYLEAGNRRFSAHTSQPFRSGNGPI